MGACMQVSSVRNASSAEIVINYFDWVNRIKFVCREL